MSPPVLRPPRAGFVVILLTAIAGSASGVPATGIAEANAAPARATQPRPATRPAASVIAHIPCISGTCQVLVPASADTLPPSPGRATAPVIARR